ncbi:MAG: hypothetical protein AAGM22_31840 [Acidobacteriota bacterium]
MAVRDNVFSRLSLLTLGACVCFAAPALAADISVDGIVCPLSDAITAANTDAPAGGCAAGDPGADTLILNADVSLDAVDPLATEIRGLFAALPDITTDITIRGGAASIIRRNVAYTCTADTTDPIFRFFNLTAGSLVLEDLVIEGACLAGSSLDAAVLVSSPGTSLTLRRVTVDGATVPLGDGPVQGGVIYSESDTLTVLDSQFQNISIESVEDSIQGSVIYALSAAGTVDISGASFRNFAVDSGTGSLQGGVVYTFVDTVELEGITVESIDIDGSSVQGGVFYTLLADSVSLRRSDATGVEVTSTSNADGAFFYSTVVDAVFIDDLKVSDLVASSATSTIGGALSISATVADLRHLQITDVSATAPAGVCTGGAVQVGFSSLVTLSDLVIERAECRGSIALGGALALQSTGTVSVQDCVLRDNRVIFATAPDVNNVGRGGGLYSANLLQTLERCSIVGNTITPADPANAGSAEGGGVWTGSLGHFANLSVADNSIVAGDGGLIAVDGFNALGGGLASGSLTGVGIGASDPLLASSTISGNRATAGGATAGGVDGMALGGGLFVGNAQLASLESNLLGGNLVVDAAGVETPEDCANSGGTFQSFGYNLAQSAGTCLFDGVGDQTGLDPTLYPLADYGCAVPLPDGSCPPTLAIDHTSPGSDAGHCGFSAVNTDGRSLLRPQDVGGTVNAADGCDVGSYEAFDTDFDGITDLPDLCPLDFDPGQEDSDADLAGDACDACPGFDDRIDSDSDGSPDGCDLCFGDDTTGDPDADGFCADSDCAEGDPDAQTVDLCGVCGGDNSSCGIFFDGFESGDTSAWSALVQQ